MCKFMDLSEKEQVFCRNIVLGMGQREAYLAAGFGGMCSVGAADVAAHRLMNKEGVRECIGEMRERVQDDLCMDLVRKRVLLAEIASGKAFVPGREYLFEVLPSHGERMKAIDLDSKIAGHYAAEKRELSLQDSFLSDLFGGGESEE